MSKTMPFNQALEILNILSKKFHHKVLIYSEERKTAIGVDIEKMHWLDALENILRKNKLWYEEHTDYLKIIQLMEEVGDIPIGIMEDIGFQMPAGFVHKGPRMHPYLFVAEFILAEKFQLGAGIPAAVPDPVAADVIPAGYGETVVLRVSA